jgi:hypothetical protein
MWFRVGSLALPQKMNLHNHIFRKISVFNIRQRAVTHIILYIFLISNPCSHSCLPGGALVLVRVYSSCDSKAGYHVYIGQSGGHWPVAKKKGIRAIQPKMAGCN